MPENFILLPDGNRLVVFSTDRHPDFKGTLVNIQEYVQADIPTYTVVADGISPGANKNILSVFNNLTVSNKRIRIQEVYVYPKTFANHNITLQLCYFSTVPTTGTDISVNQHAADFDENPTTANNRVIAKTGNTDTVDLTKIFGGNTFSMNVAGTYIIFERKGNGSSIELRPGLDGLSLRQTAGTGTTGTMTTHLVFTLD